MYKKSMYLFSLSLALVSYCEEDIFQLKGRTSTTAICQKTRKRIYIFSVYTYEWRAFTCKAHTLHVRTPANTVRVNKCNANKTYLKSRRQIPLYRLVYGRPVYSAFMKRNTFKGENFQRLTELLFLS